MKKLFWIIPFLLLSAAFCFSQALNDVSGYYLYEDKDAEEIYLSPVVKTADNTYQMYDVYIYKNDDGESVADVNSMGESFSLSDSNSAVIFAYDNQYDETFTEDKMFEHWTSTVDGTEGDLMFIRKKEAEIYKIISAVFKDKKEVESILHPGREE